MSAELVIAVLMASFNRKEETLQALGSLRRQVVSEKLSVEVFLVDDGSIDGTVDAVNRDFPEVHVINGNGFLYWGGGMRLAHFAAVKKLTPDYILWLNNDVNLKPYALRSLLELNSGSDDVVVGTVVNSEEKCVTYGGYMRTGGPLSLKIASERQCDSVDTFNGNLVLIPQKVFKTLGPIDAKFPHQYGDLDYGYRVKREGFEIKATSLPVGICDANSSSGTWEDASLGKLKRISIVHSAKFMPISIRISFCRRHGGKLWFLFVLSGYLKVYRQIFMTRGN